MTYAELRAFATSITPGDHQTARQWLLELATTLKEEKLGPHQRRYLYRLRKIWEERAAGNDARWEVYGCRAGAIPKEASGGTQQGAEAKTSPAVEERQGSALSNERTNGQCATQTTSGDVDRGPKALLLTRLIAPNPVSHTERINVTPEEVCSPAEVKQIEQTLDKVAERLNAQKREPLASPASKLSDILSRYR